MSSLNIVLETTNSRVQKELRNLEPHERLGCWGVELPFYRYISNEKPKKNEKKTSSLILGEWNTSFFAAPAALISSPNSLHNFLLLFPHGVKATHSRQPRNEESDDDGHSIGQNPQGHPTSSCHCAEKSRAKTSLEPGTYVVVPCLQVTAGGRGCVAASRTQESYHSQIAGCLAAFFCVSELRTKTTR